MVAGDGLLLTYLGDDFTGSTDVMESLTAGGVRTVLFIDVPTSERLARFEGLRAFGVAIMSRAMSPGRMDEALPPILAQCRSLGVPIVHYKVCSTFDSSPEVGSIGRAMDLGAAVFQSRFVPLVVGAPILGRYCVFGNLFARSGLDSEPYRLDRHPTMSHHPITPMAESDIRLHLAAQTARKIGLLDVLGLDGPPAEAEAKLDALLDAGAEAVLFDLLDDRQLPAVGQLIWRYADPRKPLFAVGSSGLDYALVAHWRQSGLIGEPRRFPEAGPADRMVVVSGSCSPVTDRQIARAVQNGWTEVPLATDRLVDPARVDAAVDAATEAAVQRLQQGRSVILHTSRGPSDPRIEETVQCLNRLGYDRLGIRLESGRVLGTALGRMLRRILEESGVRRAAVAGGDTSGAVARELGIEALEMIAPTAPGAPLCRTYAPDRLLDGLEIVFKGGQVGRDDYFEIVRRGRP